MRDLDIVSEPSEAASWLSVPYVTPGGMRAATIILPLLGTILVVLRFERRFKMKVGMGVDDWLIVPALLLTISTAATLFLGVQRGAIAAPTPYDADDLTMQEKLLVVNPTITLMGKVQFATLLQLTLAYGFLKLSIAFLCRRLFVVRKGSPFDWACWITIGITLMWTLSFFFAIVFNCGARIDANWGSLADVGTYCPAAPAIEDAYVTSDLLTDVLVWALPVPMIFRLHMTRPRKLALAGVMAFGAVPVIAAIIKVVVDYEIDAHSQSTSTEVDPELTISTILYWCFVEAGLGIIATCLPMLYHCYVNSEYVTRWLSPLRPTQRPLSVQTSQSTPDRRNRISTISASARKRASDSDMSGRDQLALEDDDYDICTDVERANPSEYVIEVTHEVKQTFSEASEK